MNTSFTQNIPADASVVEKWWLTLRGETIRQMPLESNLSMPVPNRRGGEVGAPLDMVVFYYGIARHGGPGKSMVRPPLVLLISTFPHVKLLSLTHRQLGDLFPDMPSSGEIGPLISALPSSRKPKEARRYLFSLYDQIIPRYQHNQPAGAEGKAFMPAFSEVVEACLLPYYMLINPDFFEWLDR